jgi:phosphoribosyl-ATP pyrophosphohydrolase/phosphoribosyl-AMP cyclohydrolase
VVGELASVIAQRHRDMPEGSYVAGLLAAGIDRIAKKVGEEAAETIIAAKNDAHDEIVWEVADLWFHSLVLLEASGVPVQDVWAELERRRH